MHSSSFKDLDLCVLKCLLSSGLINRLTAVSDLPDRQLGRNLVFIWIWWCQGHLLMFVVMAVLKRRFSTPHCMSVWWCELIGWSIGECFPLWFVLLKINSFAQCVYYKLLSVWPSPCLRNTIKLPLTFFYSYKIQASSSWMSSEKQKNGLIIINYLLGVDCWCLTRTGAWINHNDEKVI